jgi:hypothetical protein
MSSLTSRFNPTVASDTESNAVAIIDKINGTRQIKTTGPRQESTLVVTMHAPLKKGDEACMRAYRWDLALEDLQY